MSERPPRKEKSSTPSPWPIRSRRELIKTPIFRLELRNSASPRTGAVLPFYVMEAPDWVNVIPIKEDGNVILVEQFRHGTERVTLEIPGGLIDPSDASPEQAAARELLEETGYRADDVARDQTWQPARLLLVRAINANVMLDNRLDAKAPIHVAQSRLFIERNSFKTHVQYHVFC